MNQTRGDFLHSLAPQDFWRSTLCQTMGWEKEMWRSITLPSPMELAAFGGSQPVVPMEEYWGQRGRGDVPSNGNLRRLHFTKDIMPAMSFEAWLRAFLINKDWARFGECINKGTQLLNWVIHLGNCKLCIGEGNGNPLQCSCLENPRDGLGLGLGLAGCRLWGHTEWDTTEAT